MASGAAAPVPRLAMEGIRKAWPGVLANDDVSIRVDPGQAHALVGENGAGKSTLMKIACGLIRPDAGRILWNGQPVAPGSPGEARSIGIGMVFQHFSLFESLTVAENVALALPGTLPDRELAERIESCASAYGLPVRAAAVVHDLSVGERQRVEIVRCLLRSPSLLILDEPTSVLTPQAAQSLFDTLRLLTGQGTSILYISHKLHEIRALCTAATVLRAGRVVGHCDPRDTSEDELSRLMLGSLPPMLARDAGGRPGPVRLDCLNLRAPPADAFASPVNIDSLRVHQGEIVGIAGVSGNGQNEMLDLLTGERRLDDPRDVTLTLSGTDMRALGVRARRRLGLAFVPEERIGRGAVPTMGLALNGLLTHHDPALVRLGWLRMAGLRGLARQIIRQFDVKAAGVDAPAGTLSGGNLQKFIVGREILCSPALLLIAQPTWGVDVGAASKIRQALLDLRAAGAAVLVVSEDLDELLELCDAIHVVARGHVSARIARHDCEPSLIGRLMSGASHDDPTRHDAGPAGVATTLPPPPSHGLAA